jgi:hypothetical protein
MPDKDEIRWSCAEMATLDGLSTADSTAVKGFVRSRVDVVVFVSSHPHSPVGVLCMRDRIDCVTRPGEIRLENLLKADCFACRPCFSSC